MALVTITEAAKLAGCGRATIYRRISEGALSKTTMPDGSPGIDTTELLRVFGKINMPDSVVVPSGHIETDRERQLIQENNLLREQLKARDELIEAKDNHLTDLQQALRLLDYKKQQQDPPKKKPFCWPWNK